MATLAETLKRLESLHPKRIDLTLDRIVGLLEKLGNPHWRLPPVIHVAGTNGKGSTIAFLRAMLEAAGLRVHAYTSPHLITFNERIRLAGELVTDEQLLAVFDEIEAANAGGPITFFEITTVAAFVLFSRVPADVLLLEVGLGGRLDATNVITPVVSIITRISMDHMEFLGDTVEKIAAEKAGIIKPGVPVVVGYQASDSVYQVFRTRAAAVGAPLMEYDKDFSTEELLDGFLYKVDKQTSRQADGTRYPLPALLGAHQILNAAAALTAINIFSRLLVPALCRTNGPAQPSSSARLLTDSIPKGLTSVEWPCRLQRITAGKLYEQLHAEWQAAGRDEANMPELWYDGAHNDSGAAALAEQCRRWRTAGYEIHLVVGMLKTKDPAVFAPVMAHAERISTISMPGIELAYSADELADVLRQAFPEKQVKAFMQSIEINRRLNQKENPAPAYSIVLLTGSLHLAQQL